MKLLSKYSNLMIIVPRQRVSYSRSRSILRIGKCSWCM